MFIDRIERAIVRIAGANGKTIGTGCFVSVDGKVLTCDHVVGSAAEITVQASTGETESLTQQNIKRIPALDLAILSTKFSPPSIAPLDAPESINGLHVWTKGFQYQSFGITDAFPLTGTISGITALSYSVGTQKYSHSDVAVFSDAAVDHGCSGAPMVDQESGVMVGIVIAKLPALAPVPAGFALPLHVVADDPDVKEILESNQAQTAAFGKFANLLGLQELAKNQSERNLDSLKAAGLFFPDRCVGRLNLQQELKKFLKSNLDTIFPIVGYSGTGKTFSLAAFSSDVHSKAPLIFLRGALLLSSQNDLEAAITEELDRAAFAAKVPTIPQTRWKSLLAGSSRPAVIVLDALNEAPQFILHDISGWLARTLLWLRETNVKWIFSSRPEFWNTISSIFQSNPPQTYFPDPKDRPGKPFEMTDFESEEARQALVAYALNPSMRDSKEFRHPFLLRAYWEVATGRLNSGQSFTRYQILEYFVKLKAEKIARLSGSQVAFVRYKLATAAAYCFDSGTYELPNAVFYDQALFEPKIANSLIDEHIFLATSNGYRFSFDNLAEFLQAENFDLAAFFRSGKFAQMIKQGSPLHLNALSFALLKVEHEQRMEELRNYLMLWISPDYQESHWALARTIGWLNRPEEFIYLIEKFSKGLELRTLTDMLQNIRLPMPELFRLLRILALRENYYDWEPKHWWITLNDVIGINSVFSRAFKRDSINTLKQAFYWLDDQTIVSGFPRVSIADIGAGLLFRYRSFYPDLIFDKMAARNDSIAQEFFHRLAVREPAEVQRMVGSWLERPERHEFALYCLDLLDRSQTADQKALLELVRRVHLAAKNEQVRSRGLEFLSRFPEAQEEVFSVIKEALIKKEPAVNSPYVGVRYLSTHFDEVVLLLKRHFQTDTAGRRQTLNALSGFSGTDEQNRKVIDLARSIWQDDHDVAGALAQFIESRSYKEENSWTFEYLFQLALDLCGSASEGARPFLIYAATAEGPTGYTMDRLNIQLKLVDALSEGEHEDSFLLACELAKLKAMGPEVWLRLNAIGRKQGDDIALRFIMTAFAQEERAEVAAEWIQTGIVTPVSPQVKKFAEALAQKISPAEAAEAAF